MKYVAMCFCHTARDYIWNFVRLIRLNGIHCCKKKKELFFWLLGIYLTRRMCVYALKVRFTSVNVMWAACTNYLFNDLQLPRNTILPLYKTPQITRVVMLLNKDFCSGTLHHILCVTRALTTRILCTIDSCSKTNFFLFFFLLLKRR